MNNSIININFYIKLILFSSLIFPQVNSELKDIYYDEEFESWSNSFIKDFDQYQQDIQNKWNE